MNLNFVRKFKMLNEKGMGIIGVMVAAALVVVAAFTVANFVTDQWRQSMRLEISGSCQNIANSLVEYIKKDEGSLLISSFGAENGGGHPSSASPYLEYPANLVTTDDGVDAFRFNPGTPISVHNSGPAPLLTLVSSRPVLNAGWSYYNHLNMRNSTNRLVALAASGNYCCDDLDMNGGGCGAEFYSDTMPRPGFRITDRNVDVFLAVNVPNPAGGSLCTGQTLLTSNIPNSRHNAPIDFKVRVTINRDQDNQRICEATGRVQRNVDVEPSLTLLQYDTNFCGAGPTPAVCGAGMDVRIRVKTVKDTNGTNSCQNGCLAGIHSELCPDIGPGELSLFNGHTHASCGAANCTDSEPGSSFLCKIGEKSWFDSATTLAAWQPCETATVRDSDGTDIPGAVVRIRYEPVINTAGQSERTTQAVITLSGLLSNRGYVADVRAVDTAGNVGPSFCESSASCNEPLAHFVLVGAPPAPTAITDVSNHVATIASNTQVGRAANSTAIPGLASFGAANNYQCQAGAPVFQTSTGSTGSAPIDTCVATYIDATGASSNPYCPCSNGVCTVVMPAPVSQVGNHEIRMQISNACGSAPAPATLNWCNDTNNAIGITANPLGTTSSTPNLSTYITYPTTNAGGTKSCGLVTLCPNVNGTTTPVLRINNDGTAVCGVPGGWSANANSGCLANPTNNLCVRVVDPCGRSENTSTTAASPEGQYATFLATGNGTTNECFSFGGAQVGGNRCEMPNGDPPVCDRSGKCVMSYPPPRTCNNDEECRASASYQYGAAWYEPDGPKCVGGFCTEGTNKETPVITNAGCGPQYCPELNSCGIDISNTASGGIACTACNHWVETWGPCTQVAPGVFEETKSVTCPTGNCCFAAPPAGTRACPSCGTANGGSFSTAPSTNLCASGTPSGVTDTGPGWSWSCTEGAPPPPRTVPCTASKPPPVNGTCGPANGVATASAPAANLCSTGIATAVAGTGPWTWSCNGTDGGTNVNCSAPLLVNGACGTSNGGSFATAPSTNLCSAGTASAVTGTGPWNWTCAGSGGGTTANCSASSSSSQCIGIGRLGEDIWSSINWVCNTLDTLIGTRNGEPFITRGDGRIYLLRNPTPLNPLSWEDITAAVAGCGGLPGTDPYDPSYYVPYLVGPIGNPPISICTSSPASAGCFCYMAPTDGQCNGGGPALLPQYPLTAAQCTSYSIPTSGNGPDCYCLPHQTDMAGTACGAPNSFAGGTYTNDTPGFHNCTMAGHATCGGASRFRGCKQVGANVRACCSP